MSVWGLGARSHHQQYWGWCKYRYREIPKKTFAEAKEVALECLNAYPVEVIRRFVNRSWRFMDAYRKGLTGKAAIVFPHLAQRHSLFMLYQLWSIGVIGAITEIFTQRILSVATKVTQCQIWPIAQPLSHWCNGCASPDHHQLCTNSSGGRGVTYIHVVAYSS